MAEKDTSTILVEHPAEGVVLVRIDRPEKRNALDLATVCSLFDTFERLDGDPSVRCIIVTGTDDYFAAGVDLAEMGDAPVVDVYLAAESVRWDRLRQIRTPSSPQWPGSAWAPAANWPWPATSSSPPSTL